MKKLVSHLLKILIVAEFFVILITLYCLIGGIDFRSFRLVGADIFLLIVSWVTYEVLNPQIINHDK